MSKVSSCRRFVGLSAAFTVALLAAAPAVAQGIPRIEHEFPNGAKLRFFGQINKGILDYDDGVESRHLLPDRQRQLEHAVRSALRPVVRRLDLLERQRDRVCALFNRQDQYHRRHAVLRRLRLEQRQHPQDRLFAGERALWHVLRRPGQHGDRRRGGGRSLRNRRNRLLRRSELGRRTNPPLLEPEPRLRRQSADLRRVRQLRRRPALPHPLRHPVVQRLQRRLRLRSRPARRRPGRARHQPV